MPTYIAFDNPDGTRTLVEVETAEAPVAPGAPVRAGLADRVGEAVRVAATSLQDAFSVAIRTNAQALHRGVQEISPPPTEVEIAFSLKATGELGNVAIGKTGGEANYSVKLVWKTAPPNPTRT
jgi:Trypsin-co-occurring domain 1